MSTRRAPLALTNAFPEIRKSNGAEESASRSRRFPWPEKPFRGAFRAAFASVEDEERRGATRGASKFTGIFSYFRGSHDRAWVAWIVCSSTLVPFPSFPFQPIVITIPAIFRLVITFLFTPLSFSPSLFSLSQFSDRSERVSPRFRYNFSSIFGEIDRNSTDFSFARYIKGFKVIRSIDIIKSERQIQRLFLNTLFLFLLLSSSFFTSRVSVLWLLGSLLRESSIRVRYSGFEDVARLWNQSNVKIQMFQLPG